MLSEERYQLILKAMEEKGSATVQELTQLTGTSESTIRRDLTAMDQLGLVHKVHGGATLPQAVYSTREEDMAYKHTLYQAEKQRIGQYAASLVRKNDFVYIDAGTTTEAMIPYLTESEAVYVTNGTGHADKLIRKGFNVYIPGGQIRRETHAVVGEETVESLKKYNFTIGFFGTNGISTKAGFSTPDMHEARVKQIALEQCRRAYVLTDASKFNQITPITFAALDKAAIITTQVEDEIYQEKTEIVEVDR